MPPTLPITPGSANGAKTKLTNNSEDGVTNNAPSTAPTTAIFHPRPYISTVAAGSETKATKVGCHSCPARIVHPHSRLLSTNPSVELSSSQGHSPVA